MRRSSLSLAGFTLLLALAGCNVTLNTFTVPAQVWAGQVFEVVLRGVAWGSSPEPVAAILQLPNGFVVEGAVVTVVGPNSSVTIANGGTRDEPGLLLLLTPQPGHYVTSFSAMWPASLSSASFSIALKVYLRAPQATSGPHFLKAACASTNSGSGWQVMSPASVTNFASIATAPFAQSVSVVADPVAPFVLDTAGLLTPTSQSMFTSIALGDVDGDGADDLACSVVDPTIWGSQVGGVGLPRGTYCWLSRPGSSWIADHPGPPPIGQRGLCTSFGDFDGDGHLDLLGSAGEILFGNGGASWTLGPALPYQASDLRSVAVGDVDNDGRDDFAVCTYNSNSIQVFHSNGNRTFTSWSSGLPTWSPSQWSADQLILRDVTGDGLCDLVSGGWPGLYAGQVWSGNGLGVWMPANAGLPGFTGIAVGDLNRNGRPDLVLGIGGAIACYEFVNGAWQLRAMAGSPNPSGFEPVIAIVDYDRDGWEDVVCGGRFGPALQLVRNLGGQSFAPGQPLSGLAPFDGTYAIAVGDVDGDSWPDLAIATIGEHPRVFRNTGSGLSPYGSACSAAGFPTPRTTAIGQPQLGNSTFAFELQNATPNSFGMLWIGLSKRYAFGQPILPYDLAAYGAPGCAVVASTEAQRFVFTDALGRAQLPMPIPNDPALRRVTVFTQGASFAPGANNLGWLFGNGLAAKIP